MKYVYGMQATSNASGQRVFVMTYRLSDLRRWRKETTDQTFYRMSVASYNEGRRQPYGWDVTTWKLLANVFTL
jgi:hypothetical protein